MGKVKINILTKTGILGIFLSCFCAQAQNDLEEYSFVNIDQNITQRAIATITQDSLGLIWLGTNGVGLNTYDGINLVSYKQEFDYEKSLSSSLIYQTYVDSENKVWVGTESGLDLYHRDFDNFSQIPLYRDSIQFKNIAIRAIQEGATGELIVGSYYHGIFRVNTTALKGEFIDFPASVKVNKLQINSLVKGVNSEIFIGTNQGLFMYNGKIIIPILWRAQNALLENVNIESMLLDDTGALWLGTFSNGIIKVQTNSLNSYITQNFRISNERILALALSPEGTILCGTENDGLFVVHKNGTIIKNYRNNKFDSSTIQSNSIWSIFVDNQNRIWIGYYNKGVAVYDEFYDKFKSLQSLASRNTSLHAPSVTGIVNDNKGRLLIGMDGGGVDIYDPIDKNIIHLSDPSNAVARGLKCKDVQTIFKDSKDNLWVGTWTSGIYHLPKGGSTFVNFNITNTDGGLQSNRIMSFAEDAKGTIWIGSFTAGLHSYDTKSQKFNHHNVAILNDFNLSQIDVRKVLIDSDNFLWLGTTTGLFKFSIDQNNLSAPISFKGKMHKELGNKPVVDIIVSLFEDSKGTVWIGTDGAGLCEYDAENNIFKWYHKQDGLGQETIASIIEDDHNNLWLAGNNGISQMNIETSSFKNYNKNDGLLANDFNFNAVFKDHNGALYFGGYDGMNFIHPERIQVNMMKPEVYFTDFRLFNKSVTLGQKKAPLQKHIAQTDSITLTHSQSVFTIEYAGINFTRPKKITYAYMLDGFDKAWNFVENSRSATYTNLSSGNYTFKVKAANNDGIWNEVPKTLFVTILPPWWATNFAIFAFFLTFLLIMYFLYRLVKQRIKARRLVRFEREQRVQKDALNNRKLQFFTNISHEFRTPLTLIINPLEDILETSVSKLSNNVYTKLKTVHKNTARLKRLIDELMDFRKLEINKFNPKFSKIEAQSFVEEITAHFNEEAELKNIMLLVESDTLKIPLWSDASLLEKVIFNILSNAFKITPENGTVRVGVYQAKQPVIFEKIDKEKPLPALEIYVEDTGSGIKKEELENIFERFYQVKKMNEQYYGGTGIGLEVVKGFVDLLKGNVIVESEETVGTKFSIQLPLGETHFSTQELLLKPSVIPVNKTLLDASDDGVHQLINEEKKMLLIIEDNSELRDYLRNELISEFRVIEASNGVQGLQLAGEKLPDIILTDVLMPEMDGFELCTHIRQDLKTSHIPILMLTAKSMTEDWVKGIDAGADVYIRKPFEMKVLKAQLQQIITSRQVLFDKFVQNSNNLTILENTSSIDKTFIKKVVDYINENIADENLTVEHLAEELHLSRSQLYRKIKAMTGESANEFLRKIRLEKAKQMIKEGDASISVVCYKVGFSSPSYFTKCFKARFGVLPTELK